MNLPPLVPELQLLSSYSKSPEILFQLMKESNFFSNLGQDELSMLSYWFKAYSAPTGTVLLKEGEQKFFLLIVADGKINIFKKVQGEEGQIQIAEVIRDDSLGEMSLIEELPISATAVTARDSKILLITPEDFRQLIKKNCNLGNLLLLKLAKIISQRLRSVTRLLADTISDRRRQAEKSEDAY
ncbi:MAG: cyclic nucleotide-binding domain-containing protein [Candidatus Eutrophobiaceae bacterium]